MNLPDVALSDSTQLKKKQWLLKGILQPVRLMGAMADPFW